MSDNWFTAGGIVAIPLFIFSLIAIALILERLIFWSRVNNQQHAIVQKVLEIYPGDPPRAVQLLRENTTLPIARIFLEALSRDRSNPEAFRLALETAAQAEIPLLKRFNTVFETIISVSPLLGLLGTIFGLIRTFSALTIGEVGGSNSGAVTQGISEALVSTGIGLIVAIVTLLFANMFRGFYLRQFAFIQESGGQLELLYRDRYER
ncbi:MAG: MotA/TolQ/ExbB proton channel family protein, partial [Cyanobacteria bacterium P01_E01_bin.42]